jgi:hypothetical protein
MREATGKSEVLEMSEMSEMSALKSNLVRTSAGSFLLLLLALLSFGLWSCNVSGENRDHTLTVSLSDSLKKYDSVVVILKSEGKPDQRYVVVPGDAKVVNGRWDAVIKLQEKAPGTFTLDFIVYEGTVTAGQYKVDVTPKGSSVPVPVVPITPNPKVPTKVVMVTASPLTLLEKGNARDAEAKVEPDSADQGLTWKSQDTKVAQVDGNGRITPGDSGETDIVATSKADTRLFATLRVKIIRPAKGLEGIVLSPTSLDLYARGDDGKINASFKPDGLVAVPLYSSDDTSVAEVGADGRITPKKKGRALVTASPEGFPALTAVCTVNVELDEPVINAGDNRRVNPGEEVTFNIRVTQKHGKVKILKWDLDGDGTYEGSTTDSTANPKHTYDKSKPEVTVSFFAEDTEGNPITVTRKVIVGGTAPVVTITRPSVKDTLLNVNPFTVGYTSEGVKKSRLVTLKAGPNEVEIADTTAGGVGYDTVNITLDQVAPVVKITSPARGAVTNKSSLPVAWTVDEKVQTGKTTEPLDGKVGAVRIVRSYTDSAGNTGEDTLTVFRDTDGPAQPRFTAATTATPTRNRRPTWTWEGGGGGNGTFGYTFGTDAAVEGKNTSFTPAQDLPDGDYNLSVYELDPAGNPGLPASRRIRVQTKGPKVAITSPVNGLVTKASSVAVTWTVNDINQDSLKTENLAGKQGSIKIVRSATDSAGNIVEDSVRITRDTIAPTAPAFTSQPPAFVNAAYALPVQWVWTRTGGAADSFQVTVNGVVSKQIGASYTLSNPANQVHLIEVREIDEAGNMSATPLSGSTTVDKLSPPAPSVAGITPASTPTWTWSRGTNSDGASVFRYKLSTAATWSAETPNVSYSPTNLASASYTLQVQERDAAGNWSGEGSFTIVVDKAGPSLAISSPTDWARVCNFNPAVTGSVSDANGVAKVEYRLGAGSYVAAVNGNGNWSFTATYPAGANVVWVRAQDNLGNRDSATLSIHKWPNVVFVRKGMTGTGKSWEDAYGELYQALDTTRAAYTAGTEIWATVGKYDGNPAYEDNEMFLTHSNIKIKGGFSATAAAIDSNNRDLALNSTIISTVWWLGHRLRSTALTDVTIDGFTVRSDPSDLPGTGSGVGSAITSMRKNGNMTFRNIRSDGDKDMSGTLYINANIIVLENSEFINGNTFGKLVDLQGTATMRNCKFVNNRAASHIGFTDLTVTGSHFEKSWKTTAGDNLGAHFTFESASQSLSISGSKVEGGQARIDRGSPVVGTLNYGSGNSWP